MAPPESSRENDAVVGAEARSGLGRCARVARCVALAAVGAFASMAAQGCSHCEPNFPITDYALDLEKLNERAGCKDEWTIWGNRCAHEVPILWASKGAERHADWDYMTSHVETEEHECLQRSSNQEYCYKWTVYEEGCSELDFGECVCLTEADTGKYCTSWQCIAKEADQQTCWESCCGDDGCTPCVTCGYAGSSPFPMNQQVYHELLAMDGIVIGQDTQTVVNELRHVHYNAPMYNGECIVSREITNTAETPCYEWRVIETEVNYCWCDHDQDGEICIHWTCEEKDTGMFSILFAQPREYSEWVDGIERETTMCTEQGTNPSTGRRLCTRWVTDSDSYEEVETANCERQQYCHQGVAEWDCWYCDEYELKRNHHPDDAPRRFGYFFVHMIWLLPPLLFLEAVMFSIAEDGELIPVGICFNLCALIFYMGLVYLIGFLRVQSERTRAPGGPWAGLCLSLLPAWLLGSILSCVTQKTTPGLIYLPVFLVVCQVWACGIVLPLSFLGLGFVCCCGCIIATADFSSPVRVASSASSSIVAPVNSINSRIRPYKRKVPDEPEPKDTTPKSSSSSEADEETNENNPNMTNEVSNKPA